MKEQSTEARVFRNKPIWKRIFSVAIAVGVICSTLPMTAFAEDTPNTTDSGAPVAPICLCTTACIPEDAATGTPASINAACPVCAAENANLAAVCLGAPAAQAFSLPASSFVMTAMPDFSQATASDDCTRTGFHATHSHGGGTCWSFAYSPGGSTLTLNGMVLDTTSSIGLSLPENVTVELAPGSTSSITVTKSSTSSASVYSVAFRGGNSTIQGSGTLNIQDSSATDSSTSCGIYLPSGTLKIAGGTITATGGPAAKSYGLQLFGPLEMTGGAITATGGVATATGDTTAESCGIQLLGPLEMTGGSVTAIGGKSTHISNGLSLYSAYDSAISTISGGTVSATAGEAPSSDGIFSGSPGATLTISEASSDTPTSVSATGSNATNRSTGFNFSPADNLTINGGKGTAKSGTAGVSRAIEGKPAGSATLVPAWATTVTEIAWDGPGITIFSGGTGTEDDPYQISKADDLIELSALVGAGEADFREAYYKLTTDITLTEPFTPIGPIRNYSNVFSGHFDGGGNTISGLTISGNFEYAGLFGYLSTNSSVTDLHLKDVSVTNTTTVDSSGGLAGAIFGTVSGCTVSGSVTGYWLTGGLAGYADEESTIENCSSSATVSSRVSGGLVGRTNGTIRDCYATGAVSSARDSALVGGLVGEMSANANVESCYATGAVSATGAASIAGGLIGSTTRGSLNYCAALNPSVSSRNGLTGRVFASSSPSATISGNRAFASMTVNGALISDAEAARSLNHGLGVAAGSELTTVMNELFTTRGGWTSCDDTTLPGHDGTIARPTHLTPVSDAERIAAAKAAAAEILNTFAATNTTTAMNITTPILALPEMNGITISWSAPFDKTDASTSAPGSITGTLLFTLNSTSDTLAVSLEIPQLPPDGMTDAEKLAAVYLATNVALDRLAVTNATTAEQIMSLATSAAAPYGVTVAWSVPFAKTDASTSAPGSITGALLFTLNSESALLEISKAIPQLSSGTTGSSGGSSWKPEPASNVINDPIGGSTTAATLADAVAKAAAAGAASAKAGITFSNYAALTTEGLAAINSTVAAAAGQNLSIAATLQFDQRENNSVISRIAIDPKKLAAVMPQTLPLGVSLDQSSSAVLAVKELYGKYHNNKMVVVAYEQQTPLNVNAEFAARLDLAELGTGTLYFYIHNPVTNQYRQIQNPQYFWDKNSYFHFTAPFGGSVIITNTPLVTD